MVPEIKRELRPFDREIDTISEGERDLAEQLGIYDPNVQNDVVSKRIRENILGMEIYSQLDVKNCFHLYKETYEGDVNLKSRVIKVSMASFESFMRLIMSIWKGRGSTIDQNGATLAILGAKNSKFPEMANGAAYDLQALRNAAQKRWDLFVFLSYDGREIDVECKQPLVENCSIQ